MPPESSYPQGMPKNKVPDLSEKSRKKLALTSSRRTLNTLGKPPPPAPKKAGKKK